MHEEKLITTVPYNYSICDSQNPFARLGIKKKKKKQILKDMMRV